MTYWDILKRLKQDGRVRVCTALTGPKAGAKRLLKEGEEPEANSFCETLQNPPRLFVFGGGHVGAALLQMASYTDLALHLVEPRPEFADATRHPARTTVYSMPYEEAFQRIRFLPSDYLAIMTPGHQKDASCALLACQVQVAYRGMMGSRAKVQLTKDKLRAEGVAEDIIGSLHAPIGLAIGAQTPAEIAVSILAEIIQTYRQQACASLEAELRMVLAGLRILSRTEAVMCTIVEKHGSGPREVGTRMLAGPGGCLLAGTIGGGEVEAHVLRRAGRLLLEEAPFALETYHLSAESAASIGMVCGGSAVVMFERLTPPDA